MSAELDTLVRSLHEQRPLAALVGVPGSSLEAARALARWAASVAQPGLALAAWEGCAALDDACVSWLGLAETALDVGDVSRAWNAAARVTVHHASRAEDRDRAHLLLARTCLLLRRPDEARAQLSAIGSDAPDEVTALAAVLAAAIA